MEEAVLTLVDIPLIVIALASLVIAYNLRRLRKLADWETKTHIQEEIQRGIANIMRAKRSQEILENIMRAKRSQEILESFIPKGRQNVEDQKITKGEKGYETENRGAASSEPTEA